MPAPSDLVHQTTTTTGTGALTLTAENGKRSFLTAFGTGGTNTFDYFISHRTAAEWERGTGHENAGTLVRDTVIASSNANAAVNFAAGTKDVTNDIPAANQARLDGASTWTGQQTFTVSDVVIRKSGANAGMTSVRDDDHGDGAGAGVTIWGQNHYGQDSASNDQIYASMTVVVFDDADASEDATWIFNTAAAATVTERVRVAAGLYHSLATGGDKGNNTINFGAVYDDNTLLTCYPFDQYLDNNIDFAKWDARVPNIDGDVFGSEPADVEVVETDAEGKETRTIKKETKQVRTHVFQERRHEWARKFAERIGTEYDPLTLDGYAKHWKEKRHLTALPNEQNYDPVEGKLDMGNWVQRLVETVEIQAILIEQLNQRVKDVEKSK